VTGADVLLISGEPYDREVARLMLQEIPGAAYLTRAQNHGDACVWCSKVDSEGAALAPLGGAGGWRPYGCTDCRTVRLTYVRAYADWRRHVLDCESCRTTWCHDGWSLALTHKIAYEATGKSGRVVCACGCHLSRTSRRLRPYVETMFHLRYSHTGPCHGREMAAPAVEGPER
jgi:hypothetical protein